MKEKIKILASVVLGNILLAFAICAFVVPNGFMLGGSAGIALAVRHSFPQLPLSLLSAVINGALFIVGWIFLGKRFAMTSLLSTVIYPAIMAVFCVTYAKRYPAVREAVLKVDPKAFIVTTDVKNVNGRGYTLSRNAGL